jgi:putative acetyltransferase
MNYVTRMYKPGDAKALANIYYYTIHNVNIKDYNEEQVNAWAPPSSLELEGWEKKWEKIIPIVVLSNEQIVGFTEFEPNGHIDCFYVHHEFQNKGVGSALMKAIEGKAQEDHILRIYAEVSITAKPFFEKKGFQTVKEQKVTLKPFFGKKVALKKVELTNFLMEKIKHV